MSQHAWCRLALLKVKNRDCLYTSIRPGCTTTWHLMVACKCANFDGLIKSQLLLSYKQYDQSQLGTLKQDHYFSVLISQDSLLVTARYSWLKDCEFESWLEWQENFNLWSQLCVLTLIRCPFHPPVTAVARKDPGHSAKRAGGRLHLNTHTSMTQWS